MPPHLASFPNVNHLWAALLVEELVRQGTTLFVVCPGSRSTPLAVAVAQNPRAEAVVHWDERAAAFVALGWGKAMRRPAAVVTTSGTAVANLLPAAVEARQAGVPLLLLTADRPPELREAGANQAVRQPGLFDTVARWAFDLGAPTTDADPAFVLTTAAEAVARALDPAGPVHLNLPFREPLAPVPHGTPDRLGAPEAWACDDRPYTCRVEPSVRPGVADLAHLLDGAERGVVVLGPLDAGDAETPTAAAEIADRLGWPLLPDLLSGARLGARSEAGATAFDLALGSAALREAGPEAVLQIGGRPTSKRLAGWIRASRPGLYVHVHALPERIDPDHRVTHRLVGPPGAVTTALDAALAERRSRRPRVRSDAWRAQWLTASRAARGAVDGPLVASGLSEPAVARALATSLPKGAWLVAAASMPVRDLDAYAEAGGPALTVVANRGASGIDGTVATAHGIARGVGRPVALLIGDLALLHDQTSLALLREGMPVVVVVINNDGGGIFHRLPVASGPGALDADAFERFFGTPHGLGFADAARQVGLAYHTPETVAAFEDAVSEAVASGASALIEVRTDREEQADLRRRLEAAAAEAVDRTLA